MMSNLWAMSIKMTKSCEKVKLRMPVGKPTCLASEYMLAGAATCCLLGKGVNPFMFHTGPTRS